MEPDLRLVNVLMLGTAFMFVFAAFQTLGNVEKTILDSIRSDDPDFSGDGYTSLAVIYAVLAICNWITPSLISATGPRLSMVIGGLTYALFILSFLIPKTWLLYVASCIVGFGAAAIWTGQGAYLTLNSDSSTMARNSGIFWAMLQSSMFFGNIFVYFKFQGKTHIDSETRFIVFLVLTALCVLGLAFLILLRPPPVVSTSMPVNKDGPLKAFKRAVSLAKSREMIMLSVTFIYTGIELSFFSGVYGACIGFTKQMGSVAKQLVGLSGIFIGVGEVCGGMLFGLLGNKTAKWGRHPIVVIGFAVHIISFFLIYLNLPNSAPFQDTDDMAVISSNPYVAMLCSLLLGFGDSCYNTQIYSIIGGLWSADSAPAFALFKFTQSVGAAASFFYSSILGLYFQLAILLVLASLGTLTFWKVEKLVQHRIVVNTVKEEPKQPGEVKKLDTAILSDEE